MPEEKNEKTKSGLDKRKLKVALVIGVIVIPAIVLGAFATGIIGTDSGATGNQSTAESSSPSGSSESGGETSANVVISEIVENPTSAANEEDVVFENTGDGEADMSGWTVSDNADHTYTFPDGFTLGPGESVTLHTESGTSTETDLYWGSGNPIWNNAGDTVTVRDAEGNVVIEEAY